MRAQHLGSGCCWLYSPRALWETCRWTSICLRFVVSIEPCWRRILFAGGTWGERMGGVDAEGCCEGGCGLCRCWVPP